MISRDSRGYEYGSALPWSDDRTTTTYEPAQLHYLQQGANARSTQRLRASAATPANMLAAPQLDLFENTERTENPFARARAETTARLLAVAAVIGLAAAVLFTRVLLYGWEPAPAHDVTSVPLAPVAPPAVMNAEPASAPAAQPEPEPASAPQPLAATPAAPSHHPVATKHVPRPAALNPEPDLKPKPKVEASASAVAAPAMSGLGTLRINSRPWSQVFVDGRLLGNTPQLGVRLPAGRHTLRLLNPEFNMTKTITLDVSAGESISRVETLED